MATLLDLAKRLERKAKSIGDTGNEVAKLFTEVLVGQLTTVTPVDTSKALSNWQVSLEQPNTLEIDALVLGSKGSTALASADQARGRARDILKKKKAGQTIYISNNASYIRDLNDGSSKQAPAGFIEITITQCKNKLPQIKRTVLDGSRRKS